MSNPATLRQLSMGLCLGIALAGGACAGGGSGGASGAAGESNSGGASGTNIGGSDAIGGSRLPPAGGAIGSGGSTISGNGGASGAVGGLAGTRGGGAIGGNLGGAGSGGSSGTAGQAGTTGAEGGIGGRAGTSGAQAGAGGGRAGATGAEGAPSASGGTLGTGGAAGAPPLAGVCYPNQTHSHNLNNDNWAGMLTLFISYSADTRSQTADKGYTAVEWNAAVNSFDVPGFATQVANTGAKNILLMLGQNTGYYNSPNTAYETYAGVPANTRCSKRDLPMEIADALAAKGIGMYLYLPEDVGWGDTKAANSFGLTTLAVSNWVVDATFTPKWNAVIKEWADRYGAKVRGWFFDGYEARWGVTAAMANTYSATCKAANPCAIVTFNGTGSDSVSDTQRGETRIASNGLPGKGLPTSRWDPNGLQVMWDFPLQAAWGQEIADNSPAIYTNANLQKFVTAAVKAQAVFALDVRTSLAGVLSTPIYNQLLAITP